MDHPSSVKPAVVGNEMEGEPQVQFDFAAVIAPAPLPGELPPAINQFEEIRFADDVQPRPSFGEWLLAQKDRKGWIGDLGKAAKADRDFPKRGSPDDVRKRLQQLGADGDVFEALDVAEMDWASF